MPLPDPVALPLWRLGNSVTHCHDCRSPVRTQMVVIIGMHLQNVGCGRCHGQMRDGAVRIGYSRIEYVKRMRLHHMMLRKAYAVTPHDAAI